MGNIIIALRQFGCKSLLIMLALALSFTALIPTPVSASSSPVQLVYQGGLLTIEGFPSNTIEVDGQGESANTYGLTSSGDIYGFGENSTGVLGVDPGILSGSNEAVKIHTIDSAVKVFGSEAAVFVLKDDGSLWSWGYGLLLGRETQLNEYGEYQNDYAPGKIEGLPPIKAVRIGYGSHVLALAENGTVWSWGDNSTGALGVDTNCLSPNNLRPAEYYGCTVLGSITPLQVPGISGAVDIAASRTASAAVLADGTAKYWGTVYNTEINPGYFPYYSVPTSIEGYSDVKEVSANSYSVIFRRDNGDVYLWGFLFPEVVGDPPLVPTRQHPYTQPVKMQGLSLVESIDARGSGGVARLENGDLYGWYSYIYSPDGGRMIMAPVFIGNIGNYKYTAALDSAVIIGEPTTPSDEVAPVVMGVPDRMANGAGWYKAPVMINWSATDPEPSSGAPSVPAPTVANLEGEHVYTSGESCDPAGNCATGTYTVKLDTVLPAGAFGGNSQLVLRFLGQTISGSSSDVTSGVEKVALTAGNTTLSSDPNGGITLSCDTAKTSCTWTADRTRLPAGAQTYTLTVTDMAGNVYTTTRQYIVL